MQVGFDSACHVALNNVMKCDKGGIRHCQIFVKTSDAKTRIITLDVALSESAERIRWRIVDMERCDNWKHLRLAYAYRSVGGSNTLASFGITAGTTLHTELHIGRCGTCTKRTIFSRICKICTHMHALHVCMCNLQLYRQHVIHAACNSSFRAASRLV